MIFVLTFPIMMLATAVQIIVATVSRSFKETQTYLGLLPLLPSLPGMIMVFVPLQPTAWAMLIPTYGQTILIGQLVRGEHPDPAHMVLACVATVAVSVGMLVWAARLYNREQVAFAH